MGQQPQVTSQDTDTKACPANCQTCSTSGPDESLGDQQGELMTGWRFGSASAGVFLLPLIAAVVGASVVSPALQLLGGLAGLALGTVITTIAARLLTRSTAGCDGQAPQV